MLLLQRCFTSLTSCSCMIIKKDRLLKKQWYCYLVNMLILEAIRHRLNFNDIMPELWIKMIMFRTSRFYVKGFELIVQSVNRNSYIMISITRKWILRASQMATDLIISKILRIVKVNVLGDAILFLSKLCVSLATAIIWTELRFIVNLMFCADMQRIKVLCVSIILPKVYTVCKCMICRILTINERFIKK